MTRTVEWLHRRVMVADRTQRLARLALLLALVLGASAVGTAAIFGRSTPASPIVVRAQAAGTAPAFHLASVGRGPSVALPAEPVMVNFFASWCAGCRMDLQNLNQLSKAGANRVKVIGVDLNDDLSQVRALLAQDHITYPVGLDRDAQMAADYQLVALPTTVYVNAQHVIVGRTVGPLSQAAGQAWLAALEGRRR